MTQEEFESEAYQEGQRAWDNYIIQQNELTSEDAVSRCLSFMKNPYHEGTPEHRLWRLGWNNNFNGV